MKKQQKWVPALLLLSGAAVAEEQVAQLDEISVVATTPELAGSAVGLYQKISDNVVQKERLQKQSATLGNALSGELGVHSNPFGGGSSAPIIRGQEGVRIKILQNGLDVVDMSTISPDHAIAADSLLAQQIELVRGVSTLRYSTSSPAGVLNVVDNRIPTRLPENQLEGELNSRFDTASKEKVATLGITTKLSDHLALRLEGLTRHSDNYHVPEFNVGEKLKYVPDTYNKSKVGTIGLSWIGEKGFFGVAYNQRKDKYGLPGHNHKFDHCQGHIIETRQHSLIPRNYLVPYPHLAEDADIIAFPHFDSCSSDHDMDPSHSHEHPYGQDHVHSPHEIGPWVQLKSERFDLHSEIKTQFWGIDKIRTSFSHANYRHKELDSGKAGISRFDTEYWKEKQRKIALKNAGKAAGIFRNRGYNGKLELVHLPVGNLTGTWGAQYSEYKTSVESTYNQGISHRYPLVPNTNQIVSLFGVENYIIGDFIFELGARFDKQRIPVDYDPYWLDVYVKEGDAKPDLSTYKQRAFSYAGSSEWLFHPNYRLSFTASHNERLPTPMELYYQGKHLATNSFEYGNKHLRKEQSNNLELALAYDSDHWSYRISGYQNRFKNYIYNEDLFREGNLFMRRYTQAEAKFHGLEGEISFKPTPQYQVTVFGDYVRGKLFNLPPKYRQTLYDYYIGVDEDNFLTIETEPKGEAIVKNPDRNAPRVPPARLGLRFNGQFTDHLSGFLEYTYAFPQRKTAVSLSVREPKLIKMSDLDEDEINELLEGVDYQKYNRKNVDLSDDLLREEFEDTLKRIRLAEKNAQIPLHKKEIREDASKGYHLLNLGVTYQRHWKEMDYSVSLSANNILNQKIYTHTSFLPYVPQIGRNFVLGLGVKF
ncbi:hypothetical protein A1D29_08710 [Pasteurellaceae bacterium Orientalotternb1]|nr:hypothetical protein A1D29_08710 [Pasteurellaceae bacterium Orientalotternb1]